MAPPRPPPELYDDAVAEILLRLPPDDPASLARASLVCKPWLRLLSDPAFLRRYAALHRAPPVLGVLGDCIVGGRVVHRFVPTTSFRPRGPNRGGFLLDCRHGRALLYDPASVLGEEQVDMVVWDPMTGGLRGLRKPDLPFHTRAAALLCTMERCGHLHCHGGPFRVVFVGSVQRNGITWASVYSSETGAWSVPTYIDLGRDGYILRRHSVLVGEALYFIQTRGILRYDMEGHSLSAIDLPEEYGRYQIAVMQADGGLRLAGMKDNNLYLWSRERSYDGVARWVQRRVIKLGTMLGISRPLYQSSLVGVADGTDIIFMCTYVGYYMIDLKSLREVCVGYKFDFNYVFPYMSFYVPVVQ
ncbi:hypothetical protein ACP70R_015202 [Stipagrostis hirtigluma subsp. patula]